MTELNTPEFAELLARAQSGDAESQFLTAKAYFAVGQFESAFEYYRLAADQGFAKAQNNLGLMHAQGRGVDQSDEQAVAWYQKAADQGIAQAQYNLGLMHAQGRGVDQSYEQAVAWYQKAADQGVAPAQVNLANIYEKGRGVVPCDPKKAATLYAAAAAGGDQDAMKAYFRVAARIASQPETKPEDLRDLAVLAQKFAPSAPAP